MIDSTNPRIIANNIRKLLARINAITPGTVVTGNPSGSGFNTLLTKIKIGDSKYKLPDAVVGNPEDEATEALTKLKIGSGVYNVSSGFTYSTTKFDTGKKWINSKTVYGIVFDLSSDPITLTNGSWVTAGNIPNAENIVCSIVISGKLTVGACEVLIANNGNVNIQRTASNSSDTRNCTCIYIEFTEVSI